MKDNKKNEEDQMNRRSLLTIASIASLAVWHKPVINSVVLPAHAQTSCANILDVDVIGNWRFEDSSGNVLEIDFINETTLRVDNASVTQSWYRDSNNGNLMLDIVGSRPPLRVSITTEDNCVASGLSIITDSFFGFVLPMPGNRI